MSEPRVERDELIAALAARRELGAEHETAVIDAFVERLERSIDARVDREIERRLRHVPQQSGGGLGIGHIILALGSLGIGVGATGAATGMGSASGLIVAIVAWVAIAAVNIAYATSSR